MTEIRIVCAIGNSRLSEATPSVRPQTQSNASDLTTPPFRIFTELLRRDDATTDAESKVAALTHDRRNVWYRNRQRFFLADAVNRETLEVIESAMVFLVLDEADDYDYKPVSLAGGGDRGIRFATQLKSGNECVRMWIPTFDPGKKKFSKMFSRKYEKVFEFSQFSIKN